MTKRKAQEEQAPKAAKAAKVEAGGAEEIKALLSLDAGAVKAEDFEQEFLKIMKALLNRVVMVVASAHRFRLVEVEVYMRGGNHDDIFTHSSDDQLTCAQWYFHKQGKTFKGGTYKGLDITFGTENKYHGGILIRSIQPEGPAAERIVEGPCNVVDHILKLAGEEGIASLVGRKDYAPQCFDPAGVLRLEAVEGLDQRDVYASPRFGLTLKQKNGDRPAFILRDYRYITVPQQVTKGKPLIILTMYHVQRKTVEQISQLTNTKPATIRKYIEEFEKKPHPIDHFVGKSLNPDLMCQIFATLRGQRGKPEGASSSSSS